MGCELLNGPRLLFFFITAFYVSPIHPMNAAAGYLKLFLSFSIRALVDRFRPLEGEVLTRDIYSGIVIK